ncbi:hypothetical protein DFH09DRAFT_1087895 [Mycena vulgaris]|nr:hypothetical protein DFH09DRAFT_1087895 [Mycena vulgaris]
MSCSNALPPIPQAVPNHGSIEAHRKDKIPGAMSMPNRWKVGNGAHNGVGVAEDVVEFGLERLRGREDVCMKALCWTKLPANSPVLTGCLVDGVALGRAIITAETLNAPLKIGFPGDYGTLRTRTVLIDFVFDGHAILCNSSEVLPMFPEFGRYHGAGAGRGSSVPDRREDRRIERFLDIGDSRWNENKPFQRQKIESLSDSCHWSVVRRQLLRRQELLPRRPLSSVPQALRGYWLAHEGMKEAVYDVYAEGRSTLPRPNARAAANSPEEPLNRSKPVNGVDPGSKTASGWHEMPARGMDDKDQVANDVHVARCRAMKRHFLVTAWQAARAIFCQECGFMCCEWGQEKRTRKTGWSLETVDKSSNGCRMWWHRYERCDLPVPPPV